MNRLTVRLVVLFGVLTFAGSAFAAGTLTPKGSPGAAIQIREHHLGVVINNGFARTEVTQTFFNPNDKDLEAIYEFPLPKSASLSEVTIWVAERPIEGEVVPAKEAEKIYGEEKSAGHDAGLARKESYQRFEFYVHPVRAQKETRIRFVYYQPLEIDTGMGKYLYPLSEGGTDDAAANFWTLNDKVESKFTADVEIKSEWPIDDVRVPGTDVAAATQKVGPGHYKIALDKTGASLDHDFIVYYRLAANLPGRVEMVAYKPDPSKPGTFMMVITPGIDLQPITRGADYVFVLDNSGSMEGKLATLEDAVSRTLGQLHAVDRFKIVVFSDRARELTGGFQNADPANVAKAIETVKSIAVEGGTNLYDGLALGLKDLDADRATSVILVTDAVANEGVIDPKEFAKLLKTSDVRVFGFVMGNSGNWPLMDVISEASGGFSAGVSNDDDILGQVLLAKSKITSEALHDAAFSIRGVKVSESTELTSKIYRGQQLVLFGRYDKGGAATIELKARMTGADKQYSTAFNFPEVDKDNPEIERLWALNRIEATQSKVSRGLMPEEEAKAAVEKLGVDYQLVTDETSMVVLTDEAFESRGIERRNQKRYTIERDAQSRRASGPVLSYRVDQGTPMFNQPAPHVSHGGGGGAIDPCSAGLAIALAAAAFYADSRRRRLQAGV